MEYLQPYERWVAIVRRFLSTLRRLSSPGTWVQLRKILRFRTDLMSAMDAIFPATSVERKGNRAAILRVDEHFLGAQIDAVCAIALVRNGWKVDYFVRSSFLPGRLLATIFPGVSVRVLPASLTHLRLTPKRRAAWVKEAERCELSGDRYLNASITGEIQRILQRAELDPGDPVVREMSEMLNKRSLHSQSYFEREFSNARFDLLLANELNYQIEHDASAVALKMGLDVIQYASGGSATRITFRRVTGEGERRHPFSVSENCLEDFEDSLQHDALNELALQDVRHRYERPDSTQALGRPVSYRTDETPAVLRAAQDDTRPKVAVFIPVLWDANLFYGKSLHGDFVDWLRDVVRIAAESPHVMWIFKVHPAKRWKSTPGKGAKEERRIMESAGLDTLPNVVIIDEDAQVSAWEVYRIADVGITVRGTAGIEMPVLGKPVIISGTGRYNQHAFCFLPKTLEEFERLLRSDLSALKMTNQMHTQAVRHWFVLNYHRTIQLPGFKISSGSAAHQELAYLGPPEWDVVCQWRALEMWTRTNDVEFVYGGDVVSLKDVHHDCAGSAPEDAQKISDIE